MPNLVVVLTHGHLAQGLLDSAAMICGQVDQARPVAFEPGMSPEDLERVVEELLADAGDDQRVLFLADLPGGTPAKVAATLAAHGRAEVVTGVNLPMLIEVLLAAKHRDVLALTELAVQRGREGVVDAGRQIRAALAHGDEGTRP
ncbi:MAG TPA: PTS sugar transporter subunit IIA [Nocardioidaceae bacterium]|nr:PTS sugar transporter subunit IIA [Nocardioidaceae bacterium]